jgi:2-oxoisovalerate dehydrogenase E1 component alpha subunit
VKENKMLDHAIQFSIGHRRFLDDHGTPLGALPDWTHDTPRLVSAYRTMVLARTFDQKAVALQRTGKMGTYPSLLGHEAIGTAIGQVMEASDVLAPYYRDLPAQYLRGVSLTEQLLYWGGDERGSCYANCPEDLPVSVPIATQCSHAAGIASAFRIRGEKRIVVCTLGDGASSKGDFLEALNLAGAWHLPLVFVIANNQWAISTPRAIQCGASTLAQKAIGAGIPGVVADGNDFIAITDVLEEAVSRARCGKGATLIEALTYRLGDHTTADDATRYRKADELRTAWEREPIKRLQHYLHANGAWDPEREKALQADCKRQVDEAVTAYLETAPEPATAMFDHLFAEVPQPRREQYERLAALHSPSATGISATGEVERSGGPRHD